MTHQAPDHWYPGHISAGCSDCVPQAPRPRFRDNVISLSASEVRVVGRHLLAPLPKSHYTPAELLDEGRGAFYATWLAMLDPW